MYEDGGQRVGCLNVVLRHFCIRSELKAWCVEYYNSMIKNGNVYNRYIYLVNSKYHRSHVNE
jgi:hypothetical protein